MEEVLFEWFYRFPLLVSLLAGILSFLSPCVLPLIPAYMSYISGVSVRELQTGRYDRMQVFLRALFFVIGFGVVFIGLGLAIKEAFSILHSRVFSIIAGLIIIGFGLHFLGAFKIKWLYMTKRLNLELKHNALKVFAPFVLGISFALGWTPCTGPIFGAIILATSATPSYGVLLLVLYALGFALPFLALALALERGFELLCKFKSYMRYVEIISGILLIVIGALIISGLLNRMWF